MRSHVWGCDTMDLKIGSLPLSSTQNLIMRKQRQSAAALYMSTKIPSMSHWAWAESWLYDCISFALLCLPPGMFQGVILYLQSMCVSLCEGRVSVHLIIMISVVGIIKPSSSPQYTFIRHISILILYRQVNLYTVQPNHKDVFVLLVSLHVPVHYHESQLVQIMSQYLCKWVNYEDTDLD